MRPKHIFLSIWGFYPKGRQSFFVSVMFPLPKYVLFQKNTNLNARLAWRKACLKSRPPFSSLCRMKSSNHFTERMLEDTFRYVYLFVDYYCWTKIVFERSGFICRAIQRGFSQQHIFLGDRRQIYPGTITPPRTTRRVYTYSTETA